jgi:hypothetical protein
MWVSEKTNAVRNDMRGTSGVSGWHNQFCQTVGKTLIAALQLGIANRLNL